MPACAPERGKQYADFERAALARERSRARQAQPAAGAGKQRAAGETRIHEFLPRMLART
jgi:hypothetical protein